MPPLRGTLSDASHPGCSRLQETVSELGQTDMFEAMRAWRDCGFTGPFRVDHVPTMAGEDNDSPGYEVLGRLYAIGYAKGLMEGVNKVA